MLPTVVASSGLRLLLDDIVKAAEGEFAGAKFKPFINNVDPGKSAALANFTLATFTGSAALAVAVWGEAYTDAAGDANALGPLLQWDWDAGVAETVYGFVITNATDVMIGYCRLVTPKLMDDTADSLAIVPRLTLGGSGLGVNVRAA